MGILKKVEVLGEKHPQFLIMMQGVSVGMIIIGIIGTIAAVLEGAHPI